MIRRMLAAMTAGTLFAGLMMGFATSAQADDSHTINGHVDLGSAGHPAAAGEVWVSPWIWETEGSGSWEHGAITDAIETDSAGDFSIDMGANEYVVLEYKYVGSNGYVSSYSSDFHERPLADEPGAIHLTKAVTDTQITLTLGGSISGTVIDTVHHLEAGLQAYAYPSPGTATTPEHVTAAVHDDGSYSLAGLPAGDYTVEFSGNEASTGNSFGQMWGATTAHPEGVTVSVIAGANKALATETIMLQAHIVGTVQCGADCLANNRSQVSLQAYDPATTSWVTLGPPNLTIGGGDPLTTFDLASLYPGTYRISVAYTGLNDYDSLLTAPFVLAPGEFKNENLVLTRTAISSPGVSASVSSFVTALYSDYLGRRPSTSDVSWWGQKLANGVARSAVSNGFVNSDEYRLIRIDAAYRSVLGREPDAGGRAGWLRAMQAGAITTDDIERSFYASAEYYQNHGGTDSTWAASLYSTLLHRGGSPSDYAFWANLAAVHGRPWVITQFWDAPETIASRVSAMYLRYLGRTPDAPGLAGWVNMGLVLGDSGLRSALTSSDEYFAKASVRYPQR